MGDHDDGRALLSQAAQPVQDHLPGAQVEGAGGFVQSRHGVQQRRLTRSRGPHHRGETALRQVGINPVQGNHLGILAPRDVVDAGQCPHRDRRAAGSIGVDDLLRCP